MYVPWTLTNDSSQQIIFAGLSGKIPDDETGKNGKVSIALRDSMYLLDYFGKQFDENDSREDPSAIPDWITTALQNYCEQRIEKILAIAMPSFFARSFPQICSRLWQDLDIIPVALPENGDAEDSGESEWKTRTLDEQAESMARKCVRFDDTAPSLNGASLIHTGFSGLRTSLSFKWEPTDV